LAGFRNAGPKLRTLYITALAVPLLLVIAILATVSRHGSTVDQTGAASDLPISSVASVVPVVKPNDTVAKPVIKKPAENKDAKIRPKDKTPKDTLPVKDKLLAKPEEKSKPSHSDNPAKKAVVESTPVVAAPSVSQETFISVACMEGTEVFVDGVMKGRVGAAPLSVAVSPGKHTVLVSHTSKGIYTQNVELVVGKSAAIKPGLCN
jgi:hypothetical protein